MQGLYYPCSENKDADQLRGYREADLRLCFSICKKPVISQGGSYIMYMNVYFFDAVKNQVVYYLKKECLTNNENCCSTDLLNCFMSLP